MAAVDSSVPLASSSSLSSILPPEALRLLKALALSWSDILVAQPPFLRPLKGALTNDVYECCWDRLLDHGLPPRKVLLRIYGRGVDLLFDRDTEIVTFETMSRLGHGPRLLGRFPNGRVEEFLHARTLSAADLRNPDVSARIAAKLREFHVLSLPGAREAHIWERLRDWLQKSLSLCRPEHVKEFRLQNLGEEIEELRMRLSRPEDEIGFCHNDLQYGNIMMDEIDKSITIIDYEYASYNPVAYDLANHFCEMAADYHSATPHILDYSRYPGFQERCRFVDVYLGASGKVVSRSETEELAKETDGYALASHIHWGLWGIISACVNEIDFDYIEYARQRFAQYNTSKLKLSS